MTEAPEEHTLAEPAIPVSGADPVISPREYRNTVGLFATGVTVIAVVHDDDELHAMTANAVTSLSLDPPLVVFCLAKRARMVDELKRANGFSINLLREDQQPLSDYFAGRRIWPTPPPFRFVGWEGGPRLEGCIGAIACRLEECLEGGDHFIVVGRVIGLYQSPEPRRPLLFYAGTYRHLDSEAVPAPDLAEEPMPVQIFYDPW
jgi:flavin reductase (DIM6/NTAB) family NADH-FMN oxidoreductase RutF